MTILQLASHRLFSQQLSGTSFTTAPELVSWLGAVQAQEYTQAKWALGLRLPHLTDTDIEQDVAAGRLLRTHVLRPTWHFVTPEDIRWMLMLTAPRVNAANGYMYRKLELNDALFNRCNAIIIKALEGGKHLTRAALNKAFEKKGIVVDGLRLSYIMMRAELDGLVCSGARQGVQFTYALLEERVPKTKTLNQEEALATLTTRYFKSRGPATLQDFATWSGLTLTEAQKGMALVQAHFNKEQIDTKTYYFFDGFYVDKKAAPGLHLVPIYDELIMGYKDRAPILQLKKNLALASSQFFDNTILVNGQIAGTWKRTIHQKSIDLWYRFYTPAEKHSKLFQKAIRRFEQFTGSPVTVHER